MLSPRPATPFHSTSFLPIADQARAERVLGVERAVPVYTRHIAFAFRGRTYDVFAMALDIRQGTYAIPRGGIDIDRMLAKQAGVGVGDHLVVLGRSLHIVHVHSGGNSIFQTAFLNAADARALYGIDDLTSFFLVNVKHGADPAAVARRLDRALPRTATYTSEQFAHSFADRVNAGFLAVVGVLVGIGLVVGGAVIALTTYTATAEKAKEFGVLKAIGASGGFPLRDRAAPEPRRRRDRGDARHRSIRRGRESRQARRPRVHHGADAARRRRRLRSRPCDSRRRVVHPRASDRPHRPGGGIPPMTGLLLITTGLTKDFGSGTTSVRAVDHVDLAVGAGELALIMGPSGSGKTTLLSMVGGLLRPSEGQVTIAGVDLTTLTRRDLTQLRRDSIGFVFQTFNLLESLNALENVEIALNLAGIKGVAARERARRLLTDAGLEARLAFRAGDLSGGERQRVAIARSLANAPQLLLADEPTANLDSKHGREVMHLLRDLTAAGDRAAVSHDPRLEQIADRVLWLEDGRLKESPSVERPLARVDHGFLGV